MKRIRQFFWLSMGLSILTIFTNLSPLGVMGKLGEQTGLNGSRMEGLQGKAFEFAQKFGMKAGASREQINAVAGAALGVEPGSVHSDEPVYSSSGKSMLWKGQRYVLIHSKWVLERADATYTVDGTRVFFRDSGRFAVPDSDLSQKAGQDLAASRGRQTGGMNRADSQKAESLLQKVSENPFAAYSPESLGDMAKTMEAAKKALEERNKALKELTKAR